MSVSALPLLHSTCQADNFIGHSTPAVWAAAQRLAWVSLALGHLHGPYHSIVTFWAAAPRQLGSRLPVQQSRKRVAEPHPCQQLPSSLQSNLKFNLNLLRTRKFLHVHGQPGARQRHVPVTWSRTGCQPDLELSSRRYSILFGTAARRRCPVLATNWGGLCGAWSRAQRRTQP